MSVRVLLLLGGNVGDRRSRMADAVHSLRRLEGCRVRRVSRIFETAPVGPSERPYLNQAVLMDSTRTPIGLLLEAKRLEAAAGRRPGERWGPRPLDIDLIRFGSLKRRSPWLTLPHPRVAQRPFALAPLADVDPDWKPDGQRSTAALLAAFNPGPGIVKLWHGR